MNQNDADGLANSVDPDQTAPLIWVCTVCPGVSVRKLKIITVSCQLGALWLKEKESIFMWFCCVINYKGL